MKTHRDYLFFIPVAVAMVMLFALTGFAAQTKDPKATTAGKTPAAAKVKKSTRAAKTGKLSPDVQQALDIIKKGSSAKGMANRLMKLKLSENEKKALAKELNKEPYAGKLKRMNNQAQRKAKSQAKAKAARLNKQAEQQRQQALRSTNDQAMTKLSTLKAKKTTKLGSATTVIKVSELRGESSGPRANLTGVSPDPVEIGGNVTIEGENFGTTRRKVYVLKYERAYECPVTSWSETRIGATIPYALNEIVGEARISVKICVALDAYCHNVWIAPDPASLRANITGISSRTILPGQTLVIEGEHFMSGRYPGSVTFTFSSRDINGRIIEWEDNYVAVVLPEDIEGLQRVEGRLTLRNFWGYEDSHGIIFKPVIVTHHQRNTHFARALIFGQLVEWVDFDFTLINGWEVREYWLDVHMTTSLGGCVYDTEPRVGGSNCRTTGRVWMDFLGCTTCSSEMIIQGPKGLPFR